MNKVPTSLQRGLVVCFYLIGHSKLVPHLMRYVMGCISPVWPVGLCAIYVANGTVSLIVTRAWVTVVSFIALPVAQWAPRCWGCLLG